jgi:NDP-mannose synthase
MKAVILAGGKAIRLRPYTTNFPKPLMPIGERPILEIVIRRLKDFGITDIIISTGHLAELIMAFFNDGSKIGVNITYSKEEEPLGTAGPLNLVRDKLDDTFIVMNGDVLTDLDFAKLISFHRSHKAKATISLSKRTFPIEFGVIDIDDHNYFKAWTEKPSFEYLISTGIYLFEPETLKVLPRAGFFNVPDFIQRLRNENYAVLGYIHSGYWLDIGRPADYEKACLDYEDKKIKC